MLQSDKRWREPVSCGVMNRCWGAVTRSDFLIEPDQKSTTYEYTIETANHVWQFRQRGDCVRPIRRRLSIIRECMNIHCAQPLGQLCLGYQWKKQVAVVLNVKGAK